MAVSLPPSFDNMPIGFVVGLPPSVELTPELEGEIAPRGWKVLGLDATGTFVRIEKVSHAAA